MAEAHLRAIRELLEQCSAEEQATLLRELRQRHPIHEYERVVGAPAEMILEAVHRAPELTRRMLRGVIADAAFRTHVATALERVGWRDVTPVGNFAYDYRLDDGAGPVTVQVKLQRSERGAPVVRSGLRYGLGERVFMTETQKTRTGTDGADKQTRPYRFGEFDLLAVSMQPSTARWGDFMFTLGRWLLPGKQAQDIATLQPVSVAPDEFWTDDFQTAVTWLRAPDGSKRLTDRGTVRRRAGA
jgi:hypothetical protein